MAMMQGQVRRGNRGKANKTKREESKDWKVEGRELVRWEFDEAPLGDIIKGDTETISRKVCGSDSTQLDIFTASKGITGET